MHLLTSIARLSRRELLFLNERIQARIRSLDDSEVGVVKASVKRSIQRHSAKPRVSLAKVSSRELTLAVDSVDSALVSYNLRLSRKHYVALLDILCEEAIRRLRDRGQFEDPVSVVRQLCSARRMIESAFPGYGKDALILVLRQKCDSDSV